MRLIWSRGRCEVDSPGFPKFRLGGNIETISYFNTYDTRAQATTRLLSTSLCVIIGSR